MKTNPIIEARKAEWSTRPLHTAPCLRDNCKNLIRKEMDEGVYCLDCYCKLPVCDTCGKPGNIHKLGPGKRVTLCRLCYCGGFDEEYLDGDRQYWTGQKSPMGIAVEQPMRYVKKTRIRVSNEKANQDR